MKTNLSLKDELLSAIRRIVAKFWAQEVGQSMRLQSAGYHAKLRTKIGIKSRIGSRMLISTLLMLTICIGNVWGTVLFHETFGNNSGSARAWNDSYSVKSGVSAVYSGITGYTVSNCKQSKNTVGSTQSGLVQTTQGTDAYIIIGPLAVSSYTSLGVTYQWKAASVKGTYTTSLYYKTSSGGPFSEVTGGTGAGATTFVERSYSLPVAAQVSTLYLKIVFNTSNTQAVIDEVELTGTAAASCATPTALTKGSFNSGTQKMGINWTSAAGKVDICYSTNSSKPGATPGSGYTVVSNQTSTPVNIDVSSFSASDNIYVWARSVCSAESKSDWVAITSNYFTLPSHTLTVNKSGGDAGCSVSPTSQTVVEGRTVSISATAGSGYDFSSWAVSGTGATLSSTSSNPTTFTMGTANATVTGTFTASSTPTISVSTSSLSGFSYIEGAGPSSSQNFTVSGSNLTASLTVSAPTDYEVCKTSGGTYAGSVSVSTAEASSGQAIYVRLKSGKSAGSYNSENVTVASSNSEATSKTVTLSGTVLKPTIVSTPASITGWTVDVGGSPTTKSVTVTGSNLRGDITATLTGGDAGSFSISSGTVAKATAEGAGGTITISYTGSVAAAATKSTTLRLTATNATTVDVSVSISIVADSREQFTLLTNSNIGQLSDGAKVVLVHAGMFANHAMKNVTGSKGFDAVEEGDTEFEISGTTLYLNDGNHVQVLNVGESGSYFSLSTGSAYLQNSADKSLTTTTTTPLPDAAKWAISVDAGDNTAAITSQGTQGQDIRYNSSQALTAQPFRCYASSTSDDIYIYFQPSATPSIAVSSTSLSDFTYVVNNGPSSPAKTFTVSGMNLSGTLTVALTAGSDKYEISKTSATTGFGSSVTFTSLSGTLSAQTIWVRLKSDLSRNLSISGTITASGAGVAVGNNKTVSLSGSVTNAMHTLTMARSGGTSGCTTTPAEGSTTNLEETYGTQAITASPAAGYQFVNWTKTSGTLANANSASTTFTMGTANATVTANFSQIMVSSITVNGDATVKTLASKTYTADVSPSGALTKTVTWSVANGTGTATINSSTGQLTAGSPGTVTVRATATDGSGVYGELSVTVQDVVRYKFVKMTSTPSPWEDDDYLIVKESSSTAGYILKASDPFGTGEAGTGVGAERSVSISSGTITLEDDKDDAVHISYVDTKGYLVQGGGSNKFFILQSGTTTGGSSMKTLASDNTTNARYWLSITHNLLKYQNSVTKYYNLAYNSNSFRFYEQNYTSSIVLYRLETAYSITCTTPSNGTLTSDMGSAASGTTVTLTVTPSSGYELNTLTITKDGGGTITPTKVDETHYTFTMPKDNVTVTAAFVTVRSKDIIFYTPECVSTPSTLSSKATGATVTLPDEPSGTPDGFTFQGWVLAEADGVSVKPTTYAPGSYTVPSGAANINMYALYSEGELSVSGSFSNITTLGSLTVPGYYVIGTANSGSQSVLSNTLSGKHIAPATVTPSSCSNAGAVWEITKPDSYWRIKNISTNTYVASTGTEKEATLVADGSSDAAKWTATTTASGYRFESKLLNDGSYSKKFLGYSASATDYRTMASGAGGDVLYLFKAGGGAVTDNTTYTTDPQCYCDYRLMASTNSGSTWTEVGCFVKVKPSDASDHEWRLADFEMPMHNSSNLLKVQKNGADLSGQTGAWQSGWIPLAELQGTGCMYKAFELEGAIGTLRIYDNDGGNSVDANSNFYLGFYPTYQICHKNAAPDVWISEEFELVSSNTYQTAITTAPASYFADNYQYYVGVRKSDGTTKFAEKNSNEATAKSNTVNMKTMGGMTTDVGVRSGVYQIYSNSCDQNWYCQFQPYYVVYYYDVNGNEIEAWRDVLTSSSTTVHAYATSQTGWATSLGGAASASYAANASITPTGDVRLYQVAPTYTVTYSVEEESSSYDGTSVKVIQGQSITLPTITFSCALYPTFVGWVSGSAILASDPEVKTEQPATFVGAGGDSYIPTADVTLRALYGHNCDGNAGWKKQTSISAGKYFMYAPGPTSGKILTGWGSGVGNQEGGYTTDTPTKFDTKPANAVEITIDGNGHMSWGGYYAVVADKALGKDASVANASVWSITSDGYIKGVLNSTDYYIQTPNSGTVYFKCYTGTQTNYAYLYKYIKTGYYTTSPTCDIPTEFTLSFDGNKPEGAAGSVSDVPSNIVRTFSPYPTLATAIDLGGVTNPTLTGWKLTGWNTEANGSGTPYDLDDEITEFTGPGLTLYAQWERVYTVTLYDNGVLRTTLTEASAGAGVTLPSGNNCTPSSEFTFVGWTESAIQLNADPVRPAAATLHAAGSYAPTSDITLYSVYSRSVNGCDDFAAQGSGSYKMYYDASKYALSTGGGETYYAGASSGTAEVFYIAYAPAHSAYTIRTSAGYVGWNYDGSALTKGESTPYYWKISGNSSNWVITPEPSGYTKQFKSTDGSRFQLYAAATSGKVILEKCAMTYYYNTAICGDCAITFHAGGGTISGTPTTPTGSTWNSSTHVLSGLESCDKITTFPTASYEGWEFVGWSTDNYSSSGHSTSGYEEENGSIDEPDASSVFRTDGNPFVVRGGSIDLYPIFTRMPSSEPFDTENGGDYVIYYIDESADDGYGGHPVKFAGSWDGTKRYLAVTNCANATVFTFTKDGDVWHIQNKANNKYIGGTLNDDWLVERASLGTLTDWTITVRSGNQFDASCQSGRQISVYQDFFMDYSSYNIISTPGYHCIYLGSCEERIYSSEPTPAPTLDLDGTPTITSSVGQTIRATETLRLSGAHLGTATKVTLSGTNLKFATSATATPVADLEVSVTSGSVGPVNVYVYYTPTATEDGIENIMVTATANNTAETTKKASVTARHLPANFVIAAKASNDKWYALPANCTSSGTWAGVLIEVDDDDDPTVATSAPESTMWGLRNVKSTRQTTNGLGHHLTFTERLSTATADNQKTLYNGSGTNIQVWAQWTGYAATNPEQYEWVPTTTDLKDYTLTSAKTFDEEASARTLSMNTSSVFGSLLVGKAYSGNVRLLPATPYTDAKAQIIEWKDRSVVVMYTGTQTTATTKVGTNSTTSAQTLSGQKVTHAIYELTTSQSLASNDGKKLELTFGTTEKLIVEIPVIITGNSTAATGHASQDLIIVKGAKLTAAATSYSYRNIYVYGGGKLDIPTGTSLSVNNIILRAGGVSTNGSGGSAAYDYVYPQVQLVGTLTSSVANIKYEYVSDYDQWFQLCLPFDANYTSITYPQEYYGDNVAADNHGSWVIKRYDGAKRATGDYNAWVDIETDWKKEGDPKTIYAGKGYIYWGAPKKVSIGGATAQRQAWGIQRMTMVIAADAARTAENANKTITGLAAHSGAGQVNDQGWNFIGNPFMANLTGLTSESIKTGHLVQKIVNDQWTGGWEFDGDGIRYITVPDNHLETYKAVAIAASGMTLSAGRSFFVQMADGQTAVQFEAAKRASMAPWRRDVAAEQKTDLETGIVLSSETLSDEVDFWIKDGKTEAYEFNADYPKTLNKTNFNIYGVHQSGNLSWVAISPAIAEGDMAIGYQVPAAGDYTLSLSEKYIAEEIESVFVTDHGVSPELTTDLMVNTYTFTVNQAETNNERFTVSIKVREKDNTPTDIGNSTVETHAVKFIRDDKMYILRNGLLYDATGKRVVEINK